MGTKHKTPVVLDCMIEHVRYEITRSIDFVAVGNAWCDRLQDPLGAFASQGIPEAGLIHFRCLIEFLGDPPASDRVMARDYLPEWDWKAGPSMHKVAHLHGRLAHLGVVRCSIERTQEGTYSWQEWLTEQAPVVLSGARDFLVSLRSKAPARYALFVQPRSEVEAVDLVGLLSAVVGEPPAGPPSS